MTWQFNIKRWQWPWHNSEYDKISDFGYYSHYAGVGPFQFHWYSSAR